YLEFYNANNLNEIDKADDDTIVLIACRVENVRLIDNILLRDADV
ncbi:pantoate--beta-alanine ligase, partial [bacterium]|nr:pantoate--beta-alanine ligase [bacterium]